MTSVHAPLPPHLLLLPLFLPCMPAPPPTSWSVRTRLCAAPRPNALLESCLVTCALHLQRSVVAMSQPMAYVESQPQQVVQSYVQPQQVMQSQPAVSYVESQQQQVLQSHPAVSYVQSQQQQVLQSSPGAMVSSSSFVQSSPGAMVSTSFSSPVRTRSFPCMSCFCRLLAPPTCLLSALLPSKERPSTPFVPMCLVLCERIFVNVRVCARAANRAEVPQPRCLPVAAAAAASKACADLILHADAT